MKTNLLRVLLVICLLLPFMSLPVPAQASNIGGRLYGTGGDITVEILPSSAGFVSSLILYSPFYQEIGMNIETGKVVTITGVPAGEELIFGIYVHNTGDTFKMGPGDRNPDGMPHAGVTQVEDRHFIVGFEDVFGGGDQDYDDNTFRFRGALAPEPPPVDMVAPTATHSTAPGANSYGWSNQPVTVSLAATDTAQDGVTPSGVERIYATLDGNAVACPAGAACAFDIGTSGMHAVSYHAKDNAGNAGSAASFTVSVDLDAPQISGMADRMPGAAGWYDAPVTVSFMCSDSLSGIMDCSAPATLGEGAGQSATGTAADQAGNSASAAVSGINVDMTAPLVAYSGNAGSYTLDQMIEITCAATDALSGIASDTCASISGAAWAFGPGAHSFTAMAVDQAGHTGTASASFTVSATADSLCRLVEQWSSKPGVANSLCAKLRNAEKAETPQARANLIAAFMHEVEAQSGKAIAPDKAAMLISLAGHL